MSNEILADLRRLYHHVVHGGEWDSKIDTKRLGKAIEEIERLTNELAMEEQCYEELQARIDELEEGSDDNTDHN